jgi:hypothetical protein
MSMILATRAELHPCKWPSELGNSGFDKAADGIAEVRKT